MNESIESFEFVNIVNPNFIIGREDDRKRNDILKIIDIDKNTYLRIYLENLPYYVEVPYDLVLLMFLKDTTWTLDNKKNSGKMSVKSGSDEITLYEILKKSNYENYKYKVVSNDEDTITKELYKEKREEYIKHNNY